ncbi:MAG: sulfurtransferase FdhD, partial [Gammaproteobacteria bacterium]
MSEPLIEMSAAGLESSIPVTAVDEFGARRQQHIAAERALTLYIDKREIVTLMTLGTHPELLVLGWLRNQRLIDHPRRIRSIQVDWETDSVAVTTREGIDNL